MSRFQKIHILFSPAREPFRNDSRPAQQRPSLQVLRCNPVRGGVGARPHGAKKVGGVTEDRTPPRHLGE